jgi:hypothetical protein
MFNLTLAKILPFLVLVSVVTYDPAVFSVPAASPSDPAMENLTRIDYPSLSGIKCRAHFIRPQDSLETLFGSDWEYIARLNRIDRRHAYPGMTIRVPLDMKDARRYSPLPSSYEPAKHYEKYILIDLKEQWLGAYENGKLRFSMPAASGADGHLTPTGVFRIDARHRNHTSSLYKTEDQEEQYPMDFAIRFHVGADNVAYWIHARDLPGRPASHGCVGVYDEEMQNRVYGIPERPTLVDARRLYDWAVGEEDYDYDSGELELLDDGPVVEVRGQNPVYRR